MTGAQGPRSGDQDGPSVPAVGVDPDTVALIAALADDGYRPPTIAAALNRRHVPTPSGRGQWWPASVAAVLDHGTYRRAYMRDYRAGKRAGWGR